MGIPSIPSRPPIPSSEDMKDPAKAMAAQQAMADYNFALQTIKGMQEQENETRSNLQKRGDEALRNTISNLK